MNKVILLWNITQDLELKQTPNWHNVLSFSIATNSKVKRWDNWEDKAEFHDLVAWGKTAETIEKFCGKWAKILIEWQIETRNWEDTDTGKRMYRTEIIVRNFEFAWSKNNSDQNDFKKSDAKHWVSNDTISLDDLPF